MVVIVSIGRYGVIRGYESSQRKASMLSRNSMTVRNAKLNR